MTGFDLTFDVRIRPGTDHIPKESAEAQIFMDPPSAKAFHQWVADGCEGELVMTLEGLSYRPKRDGGCHPKDIYEGMVPLDKAEPAPRTVRWPEPAKDVAMKDVEAKDENMTDGFRQLLKKETDSMAYSMYAEMGEKK